MKRVTAIVSAVLMLALVLTGCGGGQAISVISREEGSGTRSAFVELMGIQDGDADNTTDAAEISQSTSVVITTVAGNEAAIGYISLGSLSSEVKAVKVDGVEPSVKTVKDGSYKVARPFNIATKDNISAEAADFISFIMSREGQEIIENEGYIPTKENAEAYVSANVSGKISLAGSTSVAPVMEVLAGKYKELNPGVSVEIQQSGSSAGITSVIEGVCDIGMASRELKESETSQGLTSTAIALDGIAVIVNKANETDNLTSEQIKKIYLGEISQWTEING